MFDLKKALFESSKKSLIKIIFPAYTPLHYPPFHRSNSCSSSSTTPLTSSQYLSARTNAATIPAPYGDYRIAEDAALALNFDTNANVDAFVIGAGVVYGYGEDTLFSLFRDAWLYQESPMICPSILTTDGSHCVPITGKI
jgi:hypothetical protein